jgi:hypothetical protein
VESIKYESEKDLNDVREKHKQEVHELLLENQVL